MERYDGCPCCALQKMAAWFSSNCSMGRSTVGSSSLLVDIVHLAEQHTARQSSSGSHTEKSINVQHAVKQPVSNQ